MAEAVTLNTYQPLEDGVTLHQEIDGVDHVMPNVPPEAVAVWEQSGWKKASAKVAKAAENREE